ncbi:hypothetical protein E1B28_008406 [Marasmius oreades]|uniref:UBA domain-containing protein n=1 Tax=Marasmius oreades TaxID=181124 RepID=A0A9P7RYG8_9AGAR|nr:uncharacterized protein E1B28_008406 [Marasmius oreades]KAG7092024.1 hypothetical protein E1B28_008406 [Marasmius oreades]
MADSFADLWNSSATSNSNKPTKPTLGSLSSSSSSNSLFTSSNTRNGNGAASSNDLFSKLSAASGPSSRLGSRAGTPSSSTVPPQPSQTGKKNVVPGGGDAFDGLFSSTGLSSTSTNMTIAQRAAKAEQEKREKFMRAQASIPKTDAAWDGLDLLGGSSSSGQPQTGGNTLDSGDDWGFTQAATTKVNVSVDNDDDDWGLGDFTPAPSATNSKNYSPRGSLSDIDSSDSVNGKQSPLPGAAGRVDSPSSGFDWGNREDRDGLLGRNPGRAEDDILGDLARPVQETSRRPSPSPSPPHATRKPSAQRKPSPPPHILGQLVEMGFSITQAKTALAATDTGQDVQGALDILISNDSAGGGGGGGSSERERSTPVPDEDDERESRPRPRHDNRRPEQPRRPVPQRQRQDSDRPGSASSRQREREREAQRNISKQADKLLAQASTIGLSLFNRANAALKDAGEKVQKVYEERVSANERQKAVGPGARGGGSDGRPKWWKEDSNGDGEAGPSGASQRRKQRNEDRDRERFVDDDERDRNEKPKVPRRTKPQPEPEPEPEVDLFSPATNTAPESSSTSTEPGAYVSPFRHGRPKPKPQHTSASASASPSPSHPTPKSDSPHPTTLVLASPTALRTSAAHKSKATEFFKLGDFPVAEGEYTKAIECLPPGQTLLITLYNNRALVRLKVGNSTGAIEDAGQVIDLVGSGNTGIVRSGVEGGTIPDGVDLQVNLGDAIVKAWKRRAEALEGKEKWEEAGRDWERVAGAEWAGQGVRGEGVRGAGRCRRMEKQKQDPEGIKARPPPSVRPKPKPKVPTPTRMTPDSEALKNLRQANAAAENEDSEKHALKDGVDGKLTAWKGGKENNIRALLASLEMVLWPEIGVPKWGMHELISEGQVKIKYMKAIAKVHPDKLSSGNFSVEQKMLAQGVFGALNDAWNSFKQ